MIPTHASIRGFTLFEILISLAVLSLVAMAALKVSGNTVDTTLYLKEQTIAHWVAMNMYSEIELSNTLPEAGSREGVEVMAGTRWPWRLTDHRTPDPAFRRLEISVWSREVNGDPLTILTAYTERR